MKVMKIGSLVKIVSSDRQRILGPLANCVGVIVDRHDSNLCWVVSFGDTYLRILKEELLEMA